MCYYYFSINKFDISSVSSRGEIPPGCGVVFFIQASLTRRLPPPPPVASPEEDFRWCVMAVAW